MKAATRLVIGCGASKGAEPAPARALYTGPLFRAAAAHAERSGRPWSIFSARHGLVAPDRVLRPYEQRLGGDDPLLSDCLFYAMLDWSGVIELHMGAAYAAFLEATLQRLPAVTAIQPLAGLQIGERLRWYSQRRAA